MHWLFRNGQWILKRLKENAVGNSDCLEGAGFHDQRMMMGEGHMGGLGVPGAGK